MSANLRVPANYQSPYTASSLLNYFASSSFNVALGAYTVSSIGGIVSAVTSWSSDIVNVPGYPGVTFSSVGGVTPSQFEQPSGLDPVNMEQDVFLMPLGLEEDDVLAGKWDAAECTVFQMNPDTPDMGQLILVSGKLAKFEQSGRMIRTEIRGINDALSQMIGRVTKFLCDADVYDARCKLDAVARGEVHTGTLTSVTSNAVFRDTARTEGVEYFHNARGAFTSGDNAGFEFHVNTWNDTTKEWALHFPMPYLPQVGDAYTIKRGCQKRPGDCTARNNIINYRGFPAMRTLELITKLPVQ
jgi:uncharacterized phage protein (TIGR02218 family)